MKTVVLLRGVNVGGHNKIAMADFKTLLEDLGYTDVRTVLQSGNAVVDAGKATSATVAKQVEKAVQQHTGKTISVLTRTAKELRHAIDANPLDPPKDPSRFLVTFLDRNPSGTPPDPEDHPGEEFAIVGKHVYQWLPNGFSGTKLTYAYWERVLKVTATARNWRTVTRLDELAR